ncbi:MAG: hypothetical protein AAGJ18_30450, partial [Bacteroidota bacterium]
GDYFGKLDIHPKANGYEGTFITANGRYQAPVKVVDNHSIQIDGNVEGFLAHFMGRFSADSIAAKVSVMGDLNVYDFRAARAKKTKVFGQLLDAKTKAPIPYGHLQAPQGATLANEEGFFSLPSSLGNSVTVSAIGYKTLIKEIDWRKAPDNLTVYLSPADYQLPTVELSAKGFQAKDIVRAAIRRISQNYIQSPYNAQLFFRYSNYDQSDSLRYQSESLLDFYDSKGYQKRTWRRASTTRFAKIQQGRILHGKKEGRLSLDELGNLFVFWSHEPIVTNDKPLSLKSVESYDFKLLSIKEWAGQEVFEISFNSPKLQERYTGLPELTYFKGKLFINKADFAVLRYELDYEMDYDFRSRFTRRNWDGSAHRVIKAHIVELFTKQAGAYALSYGKSEKGDTFQELDKDKIVQNESYSKVLEEYQYFDITVDDVYILTENLLRIDSNTSYDPSFWQQFNFVPPPLLKNDQR